jgi:hypothetical protein
MTKKKISPRGMSSRPGKQEDGPGKKESDDIDYFMGKNLHLTLTRF